MSRIATLVSAVAGLGLAACSIPNTAFHATPDGGGGGGDDTQAIVLSTDALSIPEGMTGTFDVSLKFDPGTTVTVDLASSNPTALPVDRSSIMFTGGPSGNWSTPVHVTVSPPLDSNNAAETATISVTSPPIPRASIAATAVDATQINTYGWPSLFASTVSILQGQLFAFSVTVPTSTLDSFGVIVPTAAGDFRMALYDDGGGKPGNLVTGAEFARRTLANGSNVTDITDVTIPAGTYWIALRVGSTTSVGAGDASQTGTRCLRNTDIVNLDSVWPTTFGSATCSTASLFNLWITTYHQ